jgi:Arc/MetJ-type ribon-helix-helix transcriptional regulator
MSNAAKAIELPEDLRAFAEERVRAGKGASVEEVVRDALEEKRRSVLREAIDVGVAELDAGKGIEATPEGLMGEIYVGAGLEPCRQPPSRRSRQ